MLAGILKLGTNLGEKWWQALLPFAHEHNRFFGGHLTVFEKPNLRDCEIKLLSIQGELAKRFAK